MQLFQSFFSHLPPLETDRLILRPVTMRDASDLYAYARDPEVSRHVLWEPHHSIGESKAMLRAIKWQYRKGLPSSYAITLKESGRMIGTIGFMWVNADYKSAEIGYSLARPYWNQGIMTEALKKMLVFGFDTLHLNRIEAQHETDNPASGRVMAHAGMRCEGTMRQRIINKGQYKDVTVYAILRGDPRP